MRVATACGAALAFGGVPAGGAWQCRRVPPGSGCEKFRTCSLLPERVPSKLPDSSVLVGRSAQAPQSCRRLRGLGMSTPGACSGQMCPVPVKVLFGSGLGTSSTSCSEPDSKRFPRR